MRRYLFLTLLVAASSCAPRPETTLEDTFKAIAEGKCDGFGQRFTATTRQMAGPKLERMCVSSSAKMAALPTNQRFREVHILNKAVNGDVATITAQVVLQDGTLQKPMIARLVKEEGVWRLEPSK